MVKYEYVNFQNNLYYVYRKVPINQIKENHIQDVRQIWNCDIVLKYPNQSGDLLFFLRAITDLEVLN